MHSNTKKELHENLLLQGNKTTIYFVSRHMVCVSNKEKQSKPTHVNFKIQPSHLLSLFFNMKMDKKLPTFFFQRMKL